MRFLFVGPAVCLRLPSDPASRPTPFPRRASRGLGMLRARRTSWREPMPAQKLGRRRGHPRRPPTPPYVRFRIRRFTKPSASGDAVREGSPVHAQQSSASAAPRSCATLQRSTRVRARWRPTATPDPHRARPAISFFARVRGRFHCRHCTQRNLRRIHSSNRSNVTATSACL